MNAQPLTPDRIVAEALALLQEAGFEQVSLRRLAARLGVQAMSIYWHISGKDELLRRMAGTVFRETVHAIPECTTWQAWARAFGMGLWRVQHQVRDAARLIFSARYSEEDFRNIAHGMTAPLVEFGLSFEEAMALQSSIQALVIGWTGFDQIFGEPLGQVIPIEPSMAAGLDALIAGWEARLASRPA
ncbi:TetR family transcriptional regulator [Novosphingobium sp. FSY-8]|uniref:TetR family transcriptional regulator n=1 Tax=Novosphingobium ovatum TaxID=1908523 RepID=A0ABW9XCG9_9SPHN|nr:TetR family transcriptional regulator [Novosphingobium ovatum]NBC36195.1 TetR family transcriptional regulator [Novosphingobium ovatum]